MNARQNSIRIHYSLGIAIALFVVVQAITGMAISWRFELARLVSPVTMRSTAGVAPIGLAELFAHAGRELPPTAVTRVFFPDTADGVYFFQLATQAGTRYAALDQASGRVLGLGDRWAFPVEAALQLHSEMLPGKAGHALALTTGVLLLSMAITGIVFWWPRGGNWRARLAVNFRHPPRVVIRSLHRTIGICVAPLFVLLAVTGGLLAVELIVTAAPTSARGDQQYVPLREERIEEIVGMAIARFPHARVRDIKFAQGGPATVQLREPGSGRWSLHSVVIDPQRSRVVAVMPADDNPAWWITLLPYHTGSVLGRAGRIAITCAGGALLLLACLGLMLWFMKRSSARRSASAARERSA